MMLMQITFTDIYEFTILELAETIIELTGSTSQLIFQPLPSDDPKHRCPDLTKTNRLIDWKPTTNLKDGLTKTIKYYDEVFK